MDRLLRLTYRAEQSHFWFRGFRRYVTPLLARAVGGATGTRVLDCGCGTGSNLRLLRQFGEAFGFDYTWVGVEFARGHGERVAQASLDAIPFPDASFDLVTAFDVLQCVPDEVERPGVREMTRVTRPGGHVLLHVAALEALRGRHSVLSEEYRRYTRGGLRSIVEGAGLEVLRITYAQTTLLPLLLAVRSFQRLTAGGGSLDAGDFEISVPPAPINAALSAALALEAAALRVVNMPIGSSLLCLARKPRA